MKAAHIMTVLLVSLFAMAGTTHADSASLADKHEWQFEFTAQSSKDEAISRPIDMYTRIYPGKQLREFKGVTTVNANVTSVLALLLDIPNIKNLFYKTRRSELIRDDKGNPYLYTESPGIWPVSDRDSVLSGTMHQDPDTKEIHMNCFSVDNVYPNQEGMVRMTDIRSDWILTPLESGDTKIVFSGHANPQGLVPVWLANMVVTAMPKVSLTNLHAQVQKQKYQTTKLEDMKTGLANFEPMDLVLPAIHKN